MPAAAQRSASKTCPVEMSDKNPCGRSIYHPPPGVDVRPACLMHSRDSNKDRKGFWQEIDAILNATSPHHRPTDKFDFISFVFPEANFLRATFREAADFRWATFTQGADFRWATFTKGANFREATFTKGANFREATFNEGAYFLSATFTQGADFSEATFTERADFLRATFTEDAYFRRAKFTKRANFSWATFTERANFRRATFTKRANFSWATFTKRANFLRATFTKRANFGGATFTERADFFKATFTEDVYFDWATFTEAADFGEATFTEAADFSEATFTKAADFGGVTFTKAADFGGVTFTKAADFGGTTFADLADFRQTRFEQPTRAHFFQINKNTSEGFRAHFLSCRVEEVHFEDVNWYKKGPRMILQDELDILSGKSKEHELVAVAYRQLINNFEHTRAYHLSEDCSIGAMEMRRRNPEHFAWPFRKLYKRYRWVPSLGEQVSVVNFYRLLSNYGSSYTGALEVLAMLVFLFGVLFALPWAKLEAAASGTVASSVEPNIWIQVSESFLTGMLHSLEVATFQRNRLHIPTNFFGRIVSALETVVIPAQLALLLLALRRRFRR